MLSPEYLAECTSFLLGMMDLINEQLVADIAKRIVKTGALTESAQFEAEKLTQQNILYKDIVNGIFKVSGLTEAEIARVFEEANFENMESENLRAAIAGKTPIDHASNVAMGNLLSSHIRKTKGVVKNLTRTTASQGQNAFINAVNLANMQVSSGAFTYDFAIKNAIKHVAKSGLTVQYPTGHIDKLDVAVRRAVLTGVNQSSAELNMLYCDEIGTDLVEVTAHSGARPSHADWQGGVYSLSGKSKGYGSFYDITGYGTGEGLCGWNCRHSFYAYYEGTERTYSKEYLDSLDSKTYEYGGETYTNYEAGQKQRSYERAIRAEKRYLAGLNSAYNETKDDTLRQSLRYEMERSAVDLKRKEAELKHFCKATDRRVDTTRTQVHAIKDASGKIVGFDRSAAQRAVQLSKIKEAELKHISIAEYTKFAKICRSKATEEELYLINAHNYKGVRKGYFQTPNSFLINQAMRVGRLDYLPQHDKDTVAALKNVIDRVSTKKAYLLHRTDEIAAVSHYFNGMSIDSIIQSGVAKGKTIKTKQFMSTSMVRDKNLFEARPVHWRIKAPKGTKGFANGYEAESEFVLGFGQELKILNIFRKGDKIIIDAKVGGG